MDGDTTNITSHSKSTQNTVPHQDNSTHNYNNSLLPPLSSADLSTIQSIRSQQGQRQKPWEIQQDVLMLTAISQAKVSQRALMLGNRWAFHLVNVLKRSMYVVTSFSVPIWIRIQAHCIASRASNIIMDVWGFCSCCTSVLLAVSIASVLSRQSRFTVGLTVPVAVKARLVMISPSCVILRLVMLVRHSDEDLIGSQYCFLWKASYFPGALVILFDQILVFAGWPCFWTLLSRLGMGAAAGIAARGSAAVGGVVLAWRYV